MSQGGNKPITKTITEQDIAFVSGMINFYFEEKGRLPSVLALREEYGIREHIARQVLKTYKK